VRGEGRESRVEGGGRGGREARWRGGARNKKTAKIPNTADTANTANGAFGIAPNSPALVLGLSCWRPHKIAVGEIVERLLGGPLAPV